MPKTTEDKFYNSIGICLPEVPKKCIIYTRNEFFKNNVTVNVNQQSISFRVASLSNQGKEFKPALQDGFYKISLYNVDVPSGKFYFDKEESNEDFMVAYFEDD